MSLTKRKSLQGREAYVTQEGYLAGQKGIATGGEGQASIVLPGSPATPAIFDDFLGDVLQDHWNAIDPTDTGATASAVVSAATNGTVLITSSHIGDSGDVAGICSELNWKANQGNLRMSASLALPNIADVSVFVGFTDTKSPEPAFFEDTGTGAQVSNATDAVGFLFDTQNSHTKWQAVGVQNGTDVTPVDLDTGPNANEYEDFEVFVDTGGDARFYRNGVHVAKIDDCVTGTVALTPVATVFPHVAASKTARLDWMNVSANRDTGT